MPRGRLGRASLSSVGHACFVVARCNVLAGWRECHGQCCAYFMWAALSGVLPTRVPNTYESQKTDPIGEEGGAPSGSDAAAPACGDAKRPTISIRATFDVLHFAKHIALAAKLTESLRARAARNNMR